MNHPKHFFLSIFLPMFTADQDLVFRSKQLTEGREVLSVSSGGQHTAMIVRDRQTGETME